MKRGYNGYSSFSYLDKDKDYNFFALDTEENQFEPYLISLNEKEEKIYSDFIKENIIISLHEHTFKITKSPDDLKSYIKDLHIHTGYKGLSESILDCVFENHLDGMSQTLSKNGWKWDDIIYDLGMRFSDWAHQNMLVKALRVSDIFDAKKNGNIAMVSVLEGASMIENELDRIDILYGFGIRSMGITYEETNSLGSGQGETNDGGITNFGKKAIERMNKLGILIDISHTGEITGFDTIKYSKKPIVISHTVAKSLRKDYNGKSDELIKACADKGGVIAIAGCPTMPYTINRPGESSIETYMEHFEYIKNLVGITHVSFGVDTVFGDHINIHRAFAPKVNNESSNKENNTKKLNPLFNKKETFVKGLENPKESMTNIVRWLIKHSYSIDDIKKVCGDNVINMLKEVWY